jgi:riboflavin synthase
MFTGIVSDLGQVAVIERRKGLRLTLKTAYDLGTIDMGASIACSGVCLTVVGKDKDMLSFDVSEETLSKSSLDGWTEGTGVNLERPLKVGEELGGHIVSGHVDGVVEVLDITDDGESKRFTISLPNELARFVAPKGSVTIDGVSLTVNGVGEREFDVNIVPHTFNVTAFQYKKPGDRLNMEIDLFARYLDRLLNMGKIRTSENKE